MGTIAVTISNTQPVDSTLNEFIVYGTLAFSGTYTANGDVLDLAGFSQLPSNSVPLRVEVYENVPAGTAPTGYQFVFCPGTTQANGQLAIFSTEGTQFSGAYGTTFAGGVAFRAWFQSFN
jgi:hypothetical protein